MSTILKALDKKNHEQRGFITPTVEPKWKLMLVSACIVIIILLAFVIFLLLDGTSKQSQMPIVKKATTAFPMTSLQVEQSLNSTQKRFEKPTSTVSEVNFKTKPLPILDDSEQLIISAEKPVRTVQKTPVIQEDESNQDISEDSEFKNLELVAKPLTLDDVPSDLQARFARALELEPEIDTKSVQVNPDDTPATDISFMPVNFQNQVWPLSYESHMYSSPPSARWIRINGIDLHIGDNLGAIEVIDILPHMSVFKLGDQKFTLESLQDWKG
ncbi:general secretion pathway protein GspB [Psychromonas sp.]|nr:general secretion pathway protein GspB [Psychromonas sp.]